MKKLFIIIVLTILIVSCSKEKKFIVAISKASGSESYNNYPNWINNIDKDIECVDLYGIDFEKAIEIINKADGLILSGGPDVHPGRYGKLSDTNRCSIDERRDTLEFELIKIATERKIPILGICRGSQILNVAFGGDLIVDIPDDTDSQIIHQIEDGDAYHDVLLDTSSYLYEITRTAGAEVNSNHHQGIGKLADVFRASSSGKDGIAESFEYKNPTENPWLIAVTWHPERLNNGNHTLSNPIAKEFIKQVRKE